MFATRPRGDMLANIADIYQVAYNSVMRGVAILAILTVAVVSAADAKPTRKGRKTRAPWPTRLVEQPVVVPTSMVRVAGDTLGVSLTRRAFGEPVFIAPDLLIGYREDLTLTLLHDRGLCLSAPCEGYRDMRLGVLYRLAKGHVVELAAAGGAALPSTSDPFALGLAGGVVARARWRDYGLMFAPDLYLGLAGRSRVVDRLILPFTAIWQQRDQLAWTLLVAWRGPLDGFAAAVEIPVGAGISYRANEHVELGAEFRFENLFGRGATFDRRTLLMRLAFWYQ